VDTLIMAGDIPEHKHEGNASGPATDHADDYVTDHAHPRATDRAAEYETNQPTEPAAEPLSWPSLDLLPDEPQPAAKPAPTLRPAISHLVVLGDAIADLMSLREKGPSRVENLLLPQESRAWKLTMHTAEEIARGGDFFELPADASHVMISIEGNRAIEESGLLDNRPETYQQALVLLSLAADEYERQAERLIQVAKASNLPIVVCSMYPPRYEDPDRQRAVCTALAVFNDRLVRRTFAARLPLVDLNLVCTEDADYADPIRLSKHGLRKASNVVLSALYAVARDPTRADIFF
jgi:hypothetical protein